MMKVAIDAFVKLIADQPMCFAAITQIVIGTRDHRLAGHVHCKGLFSPGPVTKDRYLATFSA